MYTEILENFSKFTKSNYWYYGCDENTNFSLFKYSLNFYNEEKNILEGYYIDNHGCEDIIRISNVIERIQENMIKIIKEENNYFIEEIEWFNKDVFKLELSEENMKKLYMLSII